MFLNHLKWTFWEFDAKNDEVSPGVSVSKRFDNSKISFSNQIASREILSHSFCFCSATNRLNTHAHASRQLVPNTASSKHLRPGFVAGTFYLSRFVHCLVHFGFSSSLSVTGGTPSSSGSIPPKPALREHRDWVKKTTKRRFFSGLRRQRATWDVRKSSIFPRFWGFTL